MRVSWLTDPDEDWDEREAPPRSRLKVVAAVLAGWLAVSLTVLVVLLRFHGRDSSDPPAGAAAATASAASTATASAPTSPAPTSPAPTSPAPTRAASSSPSGAVPAGWARQAEDDQANCTAHSYGQVQVFFARTPCSSVHRGLLTTEQDGRSIVVATSTVTFSSPDQATSYLRLVTSDGTGNVNDLLREGVRYPGSPSKLPATAFASRQDGTRVLVAEAGFTDGRSDSRDPALQAAARKAVAAG